MTTNKELSPTATRCGSCERKLVLAYLRGMVKHMKDPAAPGSSEEKDISSRAFLFVAKSIQAGVHEVGTVLLPECSECDNAD